jgi:hypothetical protein
MHSDITQCSICDKFISNVDEQITAHILFHENEWIESLRGKYKVS